VREVTIGACRLIHADCLDMLPSLAGYEAFFADPPYGVDGGSGTLGKASGKTKYSSAFEDTAEYVSTVSAKAVEMMIETGARGCVTPGAPHAFSYPKPADIGALYQPAATGMGKWGRATVQPVLYYGKDPRAGLTIMPMHYQNTERSPDIEHPCPKPIGAMKWLVNRVSLPGECVLDPFMGSGTTGIACVVLGRRFIGIELNEAYFDLACERVRRAHDQMDMFVDVVPA
jgi:DNA modification methylase